MNLKFSGRGLAYLAHFKAENDIRYYLNGVCFQPLPADAGGGVIGAATNGHILGLWHDRDGHVDRTVIAAITRPLVAASKKPGTQLEAIDGRLAVIRYEMIGGAQKAIEEMCVQPNGPRTPRDGVPAWEVEGKFPDLLKVVRERDHYGEGVTGEFNPEYLRLIAAAISAASTREQRSWCNGVQMRQHDKDGAMLVLPVTMPEALAIVMPRRKEGTLAAPWLERWRMHGARQQAIAATPLPAQQPSDARPPVDWVPTSVSGVVTARGRQQ